MVGWLIEQQQVGALPDDHGKYQACFFATTHGANRLHDLVPAEIEGAEVGAQALLARVASGYTVGQGILGQTDHVFERRTVGG